MCGIAGVAGTADADPRDLRATVEAMTAVLTHRGPDDAGVWVDAAAGVSLGHRRLAVVDLGPGGAQPMTSRDGDWVIVYNGEIYNAPLLRRELEAVGARFRGTSDTEVLVEAHACWGTNRVLDRVDGMFAYALWQRSTRELLLVRDRFGEKPLLYADLGDRLVFGSDMRAIQQAAAGRLHLDEDSVGEFLGFGYVPGQHTIYREVREVPPGSIVRWHTGRLGQPQRYWSAGDSVMTADRGSLDDPRLAADELDVLLRDSVRSRLLADVPVGALLSGGVDSSLTTAMMAATAGEVRTFTVDIHGAGPSEAPWARSVAQALGTRHEEVALDDTDVVAAARLMPTVYDQPFADSSQIPTFLVSQVARRHVTVALTGDGGDELFGGYERYSAYASMWTWHRRLPTAGRRGMAGLARRLPDAAVDRAATRLLALAPAQFRAGRPAEKLRKAAEVMAASRPAAAYGVLMQPGFAVRSALSGPATRPSPFEQSWPGLSPVDVMMATDTTTYLPDDLLVKVDRAAMAVSLETRLPFLAPAVLAFAWRLSDSLKFRDGVGKWLLRQVLYRYVPRELVDRPKQGFAVPVSEWLRGPLRGWADELVDAAPRWGLVPQRALRRLLDDHLAGRADRGTPLWSVVMLLAWLEENADPGAVAVAS